MECISRISAPVFFVIYGLGAGYLACTDARALILYLAVPLCAVSANLLIKHIVKRKRPRAGKAGYSFPSNHSVSAGIIGFACFSIHPLFGAPVLALAVITGISRVKTGVHYPIDVIAGFAVSALFAAVWLFF